MAFYDFTRLNESLASLNLSDQERYLQEYLSLKAMLQPLLAAVPDAYARSYNQVQLIKYDEKGEPTDVTGNEQLTVPDSIIANAKAQQSSINDRLKQLRAKIDQLTPAVATKFTAFVIQPMESTWDAENQRYHVTQGTGLVTNSSENSQWAVRLKVDGSLVLLVYDRSHSRVLQIPLLDDYDHAIFRMQHCFLIEGVIPSQDHRIIFEGDWTYTSTTLMDLVSIIGDDETERSRVNLAEIVRGYKFTFSVNMANTIFRVLPPSASTMPMVLWPTNTTDKVVKTASTVLATLGNQDTDPAW